jgi:DNA-binding NtrC family response regulator
MIPAHASADSYVLDDRTPFPAAAAVARIVARRCRDLGHESEVWREILAQREPDDRHYLEAIRQTGHSVFYYQMQQLYNWAIARTGANGPEDFCREVGRSYTEADTVIGESIYPFLQAGLSGSGGVRATAVDLMVGHMLRQGGNKYEVTQEFKPDHVLLQIKYARPAVIGAYLQQYGLEPQRCFRNSFFTMLGGAENFAGKMVADYDPKALKYGVEGTAGFVRFPIRSTARFAFETLTQTLVGYIRGVHQRQQSAEAGLLESSLVIGSRVMREVWERVRRASRTDEIVLLRGESGTGKSFIARKIHELSPRRDKPLIEVALTSDVGSDNFVQSNLFGHERGAFTGATETKQGLFSLADGGTIFLDEIGDASAELQAKLLRVIETSTFKRLGGVRDIHVDIRIVAATNRDLEQMVQSGAFRQDLYYRINVIPVQLPPLRERAEDVPALAQFLLARLPGAAGKRLRPELSDQLRHYAWPGNVRELEHALKHALAMCDEGEVEPADFPQAVRAALSNIGGTAAAAPPLPPLSGTSKSPLINVDALRRAIRAAPSPGQLSSGRGFDVPAHVEHAKRVWLETLIDELSGDLALIGLFWDRSSEKTLRNLVREYGLADRLSAARDRART